MHFSLLTVSRPNSISCNRRLVCRVLHAEDQAYVPVLASGDIRLQNEVGDIGLSGQDRFRAWITGSRWEVLGSFLSNCGQLPRHWMGSSSIGRRGTP